MGGSLFLPDDFDEHRRQSPVPVVVACSGFTGLAAIHPARFARFLTARGHLCFGFDYRGFAASEGERGRVLLEEQVRDIMSAVAAIAGDARVDGARIVLLGWGMGAGLVLDAARRLDGVRGGVLAVRGIVAANGFYRGDRFQRAHRTPDEYRDFRAATAGERTDRARDGTARRGDPFEIYPLDPQSREYVDTVLRKAPGYDTADYSWELADSLVGWDVEAHAPRMGIPLLIAHGAANRLHPPAEAEALHAAYGGPKELVWLEGAGHTEFMLDDHPTFRFLADRVERWVSARVGLP